MTREQFHSYFKVAMDKNSQSVAFGGCPAFYQKKQITGQIKVYTKKSVTSLLVITT